MSRAWAAAGVVGAVAIAACVSPAWSSTAISGKVTADGQPVVGAWVQLNTGLVVQTDAKGRYVLTPVPKATYAVQVLALGKQPLIVPGVIAGKGKSDFALKPAESPFGIVHVQAVRTDRGEPCPTRIVTRWRAAAEGEWATPQFIQAASTIDSAGNSLVPDESVRGWIVPFGACSWSLGETVMAVPPGQVELTCTSGILMRATQSVVDVVADQQVDAPISLVPGGEGVGLGWTCGALGCRVASGTGGYAVNLPLAATVLRAEGYDWAAVLPDYGSDAAQGDPRQVASELSNERFQLWLADEVGSADTGRQVLLAAKPPLAGEPMSPGYFQAGASPRAVALYRELAPQLAFDLIADPLSVPLLDLKLSQPDAPRAMELWSMLVSRSYRLGAASLSCGVIGNGCVPVSDRTFVQIEGELTLAEVVRGLKRATTSASTGPVVTLALGEALPGETLPADDSSRVAELDAWLGCIPGGGITKMELIRGGRIVRTWDVAEVGPNHVSARIAVRERQATWYALRATGAVGTEDGVPLVAQTSPIYMTGPTSTPPRAAEVTLSGRVYDSATNDPVEGARVKATPPGGKALTVTTGADGSYSVTTLATAMLEVSHSRYGVVVTPAGQPRTGSSTKFVAWDSPEVAKFLRSTPAGGLLDWSRYAALREVVSTATVNFPLGKP